VLFNSYLGARHLGHVAHHLPPFPKNTGGSVWLRRV